MSSTSKMGAAVRTGRGLEDAVAKKIRFSAEEWAAIEAAQPDVDRQVDFVRRAALDAADYKWPKQPVIHGVTDYRHGVSWCGADVPRGHRSTRLSKVDCPLCLSLAAGQPELVGSGSNA